MSPRAELVRALAVVCEGPVPPGLADALELPGDLDLEAHTELFMQFPPYAGLYLGPDGLLGGEGADQVAGFWRALALAPRTDADHLASLMGLYAAFLEAEEISPRRHMEGLARARAALLWEHLWSWAPLYLEALARLARMIRSDAYGAWAHLVHRVLAEEVSQARRAGLLSPDAALPRALRVAPAPLSQTEGPEVVGTLLVPVRSGFLLGRSDLVGLARATGLSLCLGPRRAMLESVLRQDPPAVLSWLAARAGAPRRDMGDVVGRWWARRAESSGHALGELALSTSGADGRGPALTVADRR